MAKKQKEKVGLVDIVKVGDDRDDLYPLEIKGSRFSYIKEMFSRCPGKLMKTNLLTVLFLLPALAWLIYVTIIAFSSNSILPYSANLGIGYPVVSGVAELAQYNRVRYNMLKYTVLVLFFILGSLGLAGGTYTIRQIMQDDKIKIFKTFFRGIKYQAVPWLWFGFILGIETLILMVSIYYFDYVVSMQYALKLTIKIILIVLSAFLILITVFVTLFYTTQNVCFLMKPKDLIKNSFLFTFKLPLQNLGMILITGGPVALVVYLLSLYLTSMSQNNFLAIFIATFGIIIFALYLFSFVLLSWSVYGDFLYENSIVVARERMIKKAKKGKK